MDEQARVIEAATALAQAIADKDAAAIDRLLAPDFCLRTPATRTTGRAEFIRTVCDIPAEILSVTLEKLEVDLGDGTALVTGVQHARCQFHGELLHDIRPFADWLVRGADGQWRARVALDLTPPA